MTFDRHLAAARSTFRDWLAAIPRAGRIVVFCHFDADGSGAGAVFGRGLARLAPRGGGHVGAERVGVLGRRARADRGARAGRAAGDRPGRQRRRTLGRPGARALRRSPPPQRAARRRVRRLRLRLDPIPCSAWLAYDLVADVTEAGDLDWIAAVGVISDLGEKAPWPPMAATKKRHTAKWLKETVGSSNAARRAPTFDAQTALDALMTFDGPKALATADDAASDRLRAARAVVKEEVAEARKAAPVFSVRDAAIPGGIAPGGLRFALVRVHSAAQVHPLIAQQWRGRLPKYPVICADTAISTASSRSRRGRPAATCGCRRSTRPSTRPAGTGVGPRPRPGVGRPPAARRVRRRAGRARLRARRTRLGHVGRTASAGRSSHPAHATPPASAPRWAPSPSSLAMTDWFTADLSSLLAAFLSTLAIFAVLVGRWCGSSGCGASGR